ncbi:putative RNA-binding protein with PIN domain [Motilibacter peucedani]|uniref:Putative RNA-binding protein with PIN domain n=1 Tax=Motilibacter peucedani TaxID=598650 RepID=A0A420XPB6_9ACTN|nr:NYN domain-containing protein [Motilibacter peucedani]RKS74051.1 putative RNA-binding protein with PIN domain [Motilibacter peucedani]
MTEPSAPGSVPALPEQVRARLVALADETLGTLAPGEVPAPLRPFLRFTPARRLRHAAPALAAALELDEGFRERVADRVRDALPGVADALAAGSVPPAAEPADLAAAAYLLRTPGWEEVVGGVAREGREQQAGAELAEARAAAERLHAQLAVLRTQQRTDIDRVRTELHAAKAEVAELRHRLHGAREESRTAAGRSRRAVEEAEQRAADAEARAARAETEARRLRDRLAAVEGERDGARRQVREGRTAADARLRLLLDVVADAATGLRRELALPASDVRPADSVEALAPGQALQGVGPRALASDDPAVLDELLSLPRVHLVVDGYNVTKSGYGGLALQAQRERLVTGLGGLVARTGAEVTCCFDGAAVDAPVVVAKPRGVRVLFSLPGETADELIRRLVANEPAGRPVVVVSSDKEVAAGVVRSGARPVAAMALVRRLERG